MKIKKEFFKESWVMVLVALLFLAVGFYQKDMVALLLGGLFVIVIGVKYSKFDVEEKEYDDWWFTLSKKHKGEHVAMDQKKDEE